MQDWMIEDAAYRIKQAVEDGLAYDEPAPGATFLDLARAEVARIYEWEFERTPKMGVDIPLGDTAGLVNTRLLYKHVPNEAEDEQIAQRAAELLAGVASH